MSAPHPSPVIAVLSAHADHRPPGLTALEAVAEVRHTGPGDLATALPGASVLLVWDSPRAVREAWPHARSLQWVHLAAAGVDALLFDELVRSPVVVTNARGVFDRPIAEFVLSAVLACAKDVHRSRDLQRQQVWQHRETLAVAGATALVLGTGAIGRETARLLRAVGMEVRGAGRTAREGDPDFDVVVASSDLVDHVGWADHLVVVAPLTTTTRGLVGAEVLAAMRPSAHLVNVGRGPVVDEVALLAALDGGALAAATLDVVEEEQLPQGHPFWHHPRVVLTPHMSGDVRGSLDTLAAQFVDNAGRWLRGDALVNVVDKDAGFVTTSAAGGRGCS